MSTRQYSCSVWILIFLISLGLQETSSEKILVFSNVASPSHSVWMNALTKILTESQHEVVLVDIFTNKFEHPNLTRILIPEGKEHDIPMTDLDAMSEQPYPTLGTDQVLQFSLGSCQKLKNAPGIQQLLKTYSKVKRPFDMIIHDGCNCEFLLGFVPIFGNPPLVLATAFGAPQSLLFAAGNYFNPAFVPKHMTPFSYPMSFKERLLNIYYILYQARADYGGYAKQQDELAQSLFGPIPKVAEIQKEAKLFLLNSIYLLDGVRHDPPNIINVGGLQIPSKRTPVEPEIEAFLDGAKDGVIYFSFGTNVMSSDMSEEKLKIFLSVFSKLPQRVLWKWNKEPIKNLPPNVMLAKWFRQSDVLAHKNVKVFISHGGLLGTQEAIFHGVPMLIIPFLCDQFTNSERLHNLGVGIRMNFRTITEDLLLKNILKLLQVPSYSNKMKEWSSVIKDQPQNPRERARFWLDFVLRHPNSNFLQSPAVKMPLYQVFNLDILGAFFGSLLLVYFVIKLTCNCIFPKSQKLKIQ